MGFKCHFLPAFVLCYKELNSMVTQQYVSVTMKHFIIGIAHNCLLTALGATSSKTGRNKVRMETAKLLRH